MVMSRIPGHKLAEGWLERSPESRKIILMQLRVMIEEMRALTPAPDTGVESVTGGQLWDCRMAKSDTFGPFRTVQDFHRYLHQDHPVIPENHPDINLLLSLHEKSWPLRFTHGDLSSLNIMVEGDRVTGIVDWETAGWYPSYWEYTTACNVNPRNMFWRDFIDDFLEPMPDELAMETIRNNYFGDLGVLV